MNKRLIFGVLLMIIFWGVILLLTGCNEKIDDSKVSYIELKKAVSYEKDEINDSVNVETENESNITPTTFLAYFIIFGIILIAMAIDKIIKKAFRLWNNH